MFLRSNTQPKLYTQLILTTYSPLICQRKISLNHAHDETVKEDDSEVAANQPNHATALNLNTTRLLIRIA